MFCSVACGVCTQAIVLALHLIGLKVDERVFEPITCIIKQSTNLNLIATVNRKLLFKLDECGSK